MGEYGIILIEGKSILFMEKIDSFVLYWFEILLIRIYLLRN